ncbi:DUF5610 domain-containing protein [Shewanella sp. YIC-542]|uniref:DUF5610 domain-containing protein n=1 Tax=Shewanella mytili TaxID=3377111 RepID=UPI00398EDFA1
MSIDNNGHKISPSSQDNALTSRATHQHQPAATDNGHSVRHVSRQLMNQAIMSAQEQVSISSGNKPMQLLFRTAIDAINQELESSMGKEAFLKLQQEEDYSPKATAERIVDFATRFYATYQQQHAQQTPQEQLTHFMTIIGDAIDKGFAEARDILDKLQVLNGDIAAGVDATYQHVQQQLDAFRSSMGNGDEAPSPTAQ